MSILIVVIYDLSTGYVFITRDNVEVLLTKMIEFKVGWDDYTNCRDI